MRNFYHFQQILHPRNPLFVIISETFRAAQVFYNMIADLQPT